MPTRQLPPEKMLRISARGLLMRWVWAEVSCQLPLPCRAADPAFGSQLSPATSMHRWAFGFGFFCFSGSCTPCTRGTESLTAVPPEVFNWFPSAPGLSRRTDVCPVHEDFAWFCHGGVVAWVALGDRPCQYLLHMFRDSIQPCLHCHALR